MQHLKCYQLAIEFYREAKAIELPHYLKDQLRRAALSSVLNISEGTGKRTMPDRLRFFQIAMGSIRECQSIVEIESEVFTNHQRDLIDHLVSRLRNGFKNHEAIRPDGEARRCRCTARTPRRRNEVSRDEAPMAF